MIDGDPVEVWVELEDGSARRADQVDHWVEPREVEGSRIGEATFALPADLPLGYHRLKARSRDTESSAHLVVTPAWLGLPEQARPAAPVGLRDPALQRPLRRELGRSATSPTSTDLAVWSASELGADYVLVNPLHAAEPLRAAGAVAVPAQLAQVLQPDLPARRADPRVRRAAAARAGRGRPARRPAVGLADAAGPGRPRRELDGEAGRAADRARRAAERGAGARLRGVPRARGRGAHRVRHLERARRGPRQRRPRVAGRPPPPRRPRGAGLRARSRGPGRLRVLAAVGARRAAPAGAGQGRGRRDAPRRRCTTSRSACTRAARTRGGCRTSTRRASRSARRRTPTTSSARTGASRRGGRTGSPSSATSRSAT